MEQNLERLKDSIKAKKNEKTQVIIEFKKNKKIMDYWKIVRDNIKYAERYKEQLLRSKERDAAKLKEMKERQAREMNAHEVKIAQAKQAINMLEDLRANSGKKIVLKIEAIQLLSKLEVDFPKNKDDITTLIDKLNGVIEVEKIENEKLQ